jgi:hypothetical protein
MTYVPDLLSAVLLVIAFLLLWRQRRSFRSLIPIIAGVIFLMAGRVSDVLVEHAGPAPTIAEDETLRYGLTLAGNLCDMVGVLLLVVGFLRTLRFMQQEKKKIQALGSLLPLCAGCKKYRTPRGSWQPIEKYIIDSGGPLPSHGLCPDCLAKAQEEIRKMRHQQPAR